MGGDLLTTLVNVIEMHVRVGENDLVDFAVFQEFIEQFFRHDRYAIGIARSGKSSRIAAVIDVRDLGCCKCDDLNAGIATIAAVEHMKVAPRGSHNYDLATHGFSVHQ